MHCTLASSSQSEKAVENIVATVVEQIELLPRKVTNPYAEEPGFDGIGIAFSVFLDDVDTHTIARGLDDSYVLDLSYVIDFDDVSVMQVGFYNNYRVIHLLKVIWKIQYVAKVPC